MPRAHSKARRDMKRVRAISHGAGDRGLQVHVSDVEGKGEGTGKNAGRGARQKMVTVGVAIGAQGSFYTPGANIGKAIADSMDFTKAPGKLRTMADMSPEELQAIMDRRLASPPPAVPVKKNFQRKSWAKK